MHDRVARRHPSSQMTQGAAHAAGHGRPRRAVHAVHAAHAARATPHAAAVGGLQIAQPRAARDVGRFDARHRTNQQCAKIVVAITGSKLGLCTGAGHTSGTARTDARANTDGALADALFTGED